MRQERQFSDESRRRLLERVSSIRSARTSPGQLGDVPSARHASVIDERMTDFSTLPGYADVQLQRSIGARLGIDNPYFRLHDGRAAATTSIAGRTVLNFSCYDYLGLNGHPEVVEVARAAIDQYGISCSASRVVAGERSVHRQLEAALAEHYSCEDAVVFVSGHATNVGVISQLMTAKDLVISDALVHNSAVLGTVLSGAARRSFRHNDLDHLEQILIAERHKFERVLIVVEGLYSMDGDFPDLARLVDIKRRYFAWLMVDEAHALGVLGPRGFGLAEHLSVNPQDVDIWMGTLSKTLAACGGYIAGSSVMVDYIRCLAGPFVYSVGIPPVIAASAERALRIMHREPERVKRLQENGRLFHRLARERGLDTGNACGAAVCPIIVGDSIPAALLSHRLLQKGINVQPVLYPAVPAKSSRLRFFLTAMHDRTQIEMAIDALAEEVERIPQSLRELGIPGYSS